MFSWPELQWCLQEKNICYLSTFRTLFHFCNECFVGVAGVTKKETCLLAQKFCCPRLCLQRGFLDGSKVLSVWRGCSAGTAPSCKVEGSSAVLLPTVGDSIAHLIEMSLLREERCAQPLRVLGTMAQY